MSWDILPKANLQYFLQKLKTIFDSKIDSARSVNYKTLTYDDLTKEITEGSLQSTSFINLPSLVNNIRTTLVTSVNDIGPEVDSKADLSDITYPNYGINMYNPETHKLDILVTTTDTPIKSANNDVKEIHEIAINANADWVAKETAGAKTVTGNPLTITDASPNKAEKIEIGFTPKQDKHGYNSVWVGGAGKNKLMSPVKSITSRQVTFTCDGNGKITANGTASGTPDQCYIDVQTEFGALKKGGTYKIVSNGDIYFNILVQVNGSYIKIVDASKSATFTIDANATQILIRAVPYFNGYQYNNAVSYPVIVESTETDTSFSSYENISPITGYTSLSVDGCGENLIDPAKITESSVHVNSYIYSDGDGLLVDAGQYTFSASQQCNGLYVSEAVEGASSISYVNNSDVLTFTIPNKMYIKMQSWRNSGVTGMTYQLEKGNQATPYKPYNSRNVTVQFGQTLYGGKLTILQDWSADVYCDTGFGEFDGSSDENWTLVDNNSIKTDYIFPAMKTATSTWIYAFSSDFSAGADGVAPSTWLTTYATNNPTALEFRNIVSNWGISAYTVDAWKSYLASRSIPLQVAYELKDPFTIHLSPVKTITLLQGINNVWTDGAALSLTYQPDNVIGESKIYSNEAAEIVAKKYTTETDSTNSTPYLYRASQNSGDRCYLRQLVGVSFRVNQLQLKPTAINSFYANNCASTAFENDIVSFTVNAKNGNVNLYPSRMALVSGHKYLMRASIKASSTNVILVPVNSGTYVSVTKVNTFELVEKVFNANSDYTTYLEVRDGRSTGWDQIQAKDFQLIDLTQYFGAPIADKSYTMEQSTAGSGIAWLKSYGFFRESYYPYNTGSLESVKPSGKVCCGKNWFDIENWLTTASAAYTKNDNTYSISNFVAVYNYYNTNGLYQFYKDDEDIIISFSVDSPVMPYLRPVFILYDKNNNEIARSAVGSGSRIVKGKGCKLGLTYSTGSQGTAITLTNFQIEQGTTEPTAYEPHTTHTTSISSIDLRGVPTLVDNNIVYDGDVRDESGVVTRKYGIVDLGTQTFGGAGVTSVFYCSLSGRKTGACKMIISNNYTYSNPYTSGNDKCYIENDDAGATQIYFKDSAYTSYTDFKTAMSGVYLVYELATPYTEQTDPIQNPGIYNKFGWEQFIDNRSFPIPVGHNSEYVNLPDWMETGYADDLRDRVDYDIPKAIERLSNDNYSRNIFGIDNSPLMFNVYGGKVETSTTHGSISAANGGIISSGRNSSTGISVLLGYLDVGTYTVSVATKNATMYVTTTGQTYPANGVSISDITSSENNSITFTLSEAKYVNLGFFVSSNIDLYCTNIQLEHGKDQTPYDEYIPTNKELWEMIKALQN